ncbi:MAG: hypothetical protein WBA57_18500 [Elainellaceae cyanobacterium]
MDKPIKKNYPKQQSSPLRRVVVVLSDKGGVGKSQVGRTTMHYHIDRNIPVLGCDCDRSNQSLLDYYQDEVEVICTFFSEDPKKAWNADYILEAVAEYQKDIIVDTPAQVFRSFRDYLKKGGLKAATRQGVEFIFLLVVADRYSLEQCLDLIQEFGGAVSFILVLNEGCCDDFSFIDDHETCQAIVEKFSIPVIYFPELPYREREIIDQLRLPFSAALQSEHFTIVGRQRVQDFLTDCFEQFDRLNIFGEEMHGE